MVIKGHIDYEVIPVMKNISTICLIALSLIVHVTYAQEDRDFQSQFWNKLIAMEGKAFAGKLVIGTEPSDADFMKGAAIMHVWKVSEHEIRIPFHIGENRSRTWVLTKTDNGLRLKHDHRKPDGSDDPVTQYGGDTSNKGTPVRQEFKADEFTGAMLPASAKNIWAIEVEAMNRFVYELRREHEDRFFRVEFDLSNPVATPPRAWGDED